MDLVKKKKKKKGDAPDVSQGKTASFGDPGIQKVLFSPSLDDVLKLQMAV